MCQCEKTLISLLQREREREGVWWSAVCTCLCWCAHSNRLLSVCMCVKVCHHFAQLENLLFTTTKQCCLFFFLLYCNLLCFLCFLFTSCTCSHTHTHIRAELFVCTVCVCKCKLETETGLLVQMRALFFFVCFFCSKQPAVVPLTPPLSGTVFLFLLCTCHSAKTAAAAVAAGGRKWSAND